ncbi:MAG TPA: putative transporter [Porphyromonadaceae bacterium]|jgi:AspT/YidE/YbjL antiporter-like protein|nr:putative transporter [Porphyromonadaceae bacterium]HBL34600.1 putative transporter [Porphyromonadaceae bacterium]HBX20657.1 putative transporter [Porphyromonadaceae bacterium]HCM19848.1 putative transporter [Porphyromonadaceae bacterium]
MEFLDTIFKEHSVIQALIVISMVCALGLALGKVKVRGISLGVTFVFFIGILAGHLGLTLDAQMLNYAENFGLLVFIYALGLQVGPAFFSSWGKSGMKLNLLALSVVFVGIGLTLILQQFSGVSLPDMVGIMSGATTNTPMLGAAQETLQQINTEEFSKSNMTLGLALTYPLGIVGVIFALIVIRKMLAKHLHITNTNEDRRNKTVIVGFEVNNPAIFGRTIQEIAYLIAKRFVISRVWREGKAIVPTSQTIIQEGDHLLIITTESTADLLSAIIGKKEDRDWNREDIDWDKIDNQLESHRIVITRPEINGKRLGSLRLRNLYGINVSRIHRSGVVLLPTPDLVLFMGDRLTVVGEAKAISNVEKVLGNAVKNLDEPNLVSVFAGMVLSLLVGSIPLFIPGISSPVKLGLAGGAIVVGILVGAFGPRVHMITYTTISANLMLRGLGLSTFLACLGLDAGVHFFETVFRPEGALWIGLGFAITVIPVIIVGFAAIRFMKMDFGTIAGMLCGSMANPMALNYINSTIEGDSPSVAYATVYPLTMFSRLVTAQLLLMLFL